ncbi:MAG: outer membrane beta-barrel protein [Alistipes sp.]|nr:outer membrane beta-barrel protein [Alistipes sp.]
MSGPIRYALLAFALLAGVVSAAAQQQQDEIFRPNDGRRRRSRLSMEWNVQAGATLSEYSAHGTTAEIAPKAGYHFSMAIGMLFHPNFAVVPELRFSHAAFDMTGRAGGSSSVKGNTLDFPIRFEGRILRGRLRFYAGPAFTLMDKYRFSYGGSTEEGMRIRPTVTYVAGIAGVPVRRMTVDVRFNGQFNRTEQIYGWRAADPDYAEYRLGIHGFSVSIGYLF